MQLLEDVCFRKPRKLPVRSKPKTDKDGGGDVSSSSSHHHPCASKAEDEDGAEQERNYLRAQMQKSLANFRDICYCASLRSQQPGVVHAVPAACAPVTAVVNTTASGGAAKNSVGTHAEPDVKPVRSSAEPSVDAGLLACISHALTFVGNASHFFKVDLDAYQPVQSSPVVVRRDEVCAEYLKEVLPEISISAEEAKETTKRKPKKRSIARDGGKENNPSDSTTAPCATASPIKHEKMLPCDPVPRVFSEEDIDTSKESAGSSASKNAKSEGLVEDAKSQHVVRRDVPMSSEMEDTTGVGVAVAFSKEEAQSRLCIETAPRKKNSNITGYFCRVNSPKRRKLSDAGEHRPQESTCAASAASSSSQQRRSTDSGKIKMESQEEPASDLCNMTPPPKRSKVSSHPLPPHTNTKQDADAAKKDCQELLPLCDDTADREETIRQKGFLVEQTAPLAGDDPDEVVYNVTKQYHPSFLVWRLLGWWDPNCEGNEPLLSLLPSAIQPDPLALFQVAEAHQKAVFKRLSSVMKPEQPSALRKGFSFLSGGRRKDASGSSHGGEGDSLLLGHVLGHGGSLDSLYPQCLGMRREKPASMGGAHLSFLSSTLGGPELDDALAFFAKFESSGVDFLDDEKDRENSRRANHEVRTG